MADFGDCEKSSVWISRNNKRVYARLTANDYVPLNTRATYADGTSDSKNVSGTLTSTHLASAPLYKADKPFKRIHVGNLVKRIATSTNQAWGDTEEVIIHKQVTTIDANAFEGSKLINMVVPGNITSVGNCAFKDCT